MRVRGPGEAGGRGVWGRYLGMYVCKYLMYCTVLYLYVRYQGSSQGVLLPGVRKLRECVGGGGHGPIHGCWKGARVRAGVRQMGVTMSACVYKSLGVVLECRRDLFRCSG